MEDWDWKIKQIENKFSSFRSGRKNCKAKTYYSTDFQPKFPDFLAKWYTHHKGVPVKKILVLVQAPGKGRRPTPSSLPYEFFSFALVGSPNFFRPRRELQSWTK